MAGDYRGQVSIILGGGGDYLGSVSVVGGIPAGLITGLTPQQVLFGSPTGNIQQSPSLLFDTATNRQTTTRELISETALAAPASTERNALQVQQNIQFATGPIATQRATALDRPTYSAVGASTITTAPTLAIKGEPIAGPNVTLTNPYALHVERGRSQFDGDIACPGSGGATSLRLGPSALASNINAASVGPAANAAGNGSTALGANTSATGGGATALGSAASANQTGAIGIGNGAQTTTANQCVIGGPSSFLTFISNLFVGSGVTDSAPTSATINGTGASGSNVVGATLAHAAGRSTGNATPAPLTFLTGTAGASGTTPQTLSERARFDGLGNFLLGTTTASTATKHLVIGSTTTGVPAAPGTNLFLGALDDGGGNVRLSVFSSEVVQAVAPVPDHKVLVSWNGVLYYLALEAA